MRPEMRLGLVVFAMLIAGVGIIYFTMQGGETGEVPVNNPNANPDPDPVSETEAAIPSSRSSRTRSSTPSVSNSASGSRTATPDVTPGQGDLRPSIAQRNAAGRSGNSTMNSTNSADPTNSGSSSRRSPESPVATPSNTPFGGDAEDVRPTQTPPTRPSSADDDTTASRNSTNDRPTERERDSGPVTTPTRGDSQSSPPAASQSSNEREPEVELLRPVEDQPATRETDRPEARRESPATSSGSAAGRTHTVTRGERLWDLAAAEYGDGKYWGIIARANPDINPDRLLVGQKLKIPPKSAVIKPPARGAAQPNADQPDARPKPEAKPEKPEPKTRIYTVEAGDSLIKIADALYADKDRWRQIYELNRDQLKKPNLIQPGMKLKVPPL